MACHERVPPSVLPAHIHVVCPAAVPLLAQARAVARATFGSSTQTALVVSASLGDPVHKGGAWGCVGWVSGRASVHTRSYSLLYHGSWLQCIAACRPACRCSHARSGAAVCMQTGVTRTGCWRHTGALSPAWAIGRPPTTVEAEEPSQGTFGGRYGIYVPCDLLATLGFCEQGFWRTPQLFPGRLVSLDDDGTGALWFCHRGC